MGDSSGGATARAPTQPLGQVQNNFAPWNLSVQPAQLTQQAPQLSQPQYASLTPQNAPSPANAGIPARDFGPVTPMGSFNVTKQFSPITLGGRTVMLDEQGRPPQNYAEWLAARRS